jgi:hypothetical protein
VRKVEVWRAGQCTDGYLLTMAKRALSETEIDQHTILRADKKIKLQDE